MLPISEHHLAQATDHDRLMADLAGLAKGVSTGACTSVPLAGLTVLGENLLNAAPGDFSALPIRWDPQKTFALGGLPAFTAFGGILRVPMLLGAAMAGRTDLRSRFMQNGFFVPEVALQWLVCHGLNEHCLWHGLTSDFVADLLRPSVLLEIGKVPPLALLLMQERADLRSRFVPERRWSQPAFDHWLGTYGISDYGLFWCMGKTHTDMWAGHGWSIAQTALPPREARTLDPTERRFREPALDWIGNRTSAWRAAGRLFPAFEMEAFGLGGRLVSAGRIAPSTRWLRFAASRIDLLVPRSRQPERFCILELSRSGPDAMRRCSLFLNGVALPTGTLPGCENAITIAWIGAAGNATGNGALDVLTLDLGAGVVDGTQDGTFELIRMWNL